MQHIRVLMEKGHVFGAHALHLQPSSLDLSISDEIYRMQGTFLPRRGERVRDIIKEGALFQTNLSQPLELNGIYLIRLNETMALPPEIFAYTNNKSSSGRVNLQTRLVVDGVDEFDKLPRGHVGELWLEVVPKSFPVKLTAGERLNQMRFFTSDTRLSTDEHMTGHMQHHFLCDQDGKPIYNESLARGGGITMSIDLSSEEIIGYKCTPTTCRVLDFARRDHDPLEFFEPIRRPKNGQIVMKRDEFYIFVTKEGIRVPLEYAVEMAPYDVSKGEFRSHYAGFFDPGFGFGPNGDVFGTPGVLEVFTHDNDFVLRDGQPICKMVYERLAEKPEIAYGSSALSSNYFGQRGPRLSKHFRHN